MKMSRKMFSSEFEKKLTLLSFPSIFENSPRKIDSTNFLRVIIKNIPKSLENSYNKQRYFCNGGHARNWSSKIPCSSERYASFNEAHFVESTRLIFTSSVGNFYPDGVGNRRLFSGPRSPRLCTYFTFFLSSLRFFFFLFN